MKHRNVMIGFFLVILPAVIFCLSGCQGSETMASESKKAEAVTEAEISSADTEVSETTMSDTAVAVYYFHGNRRCRACIVLENTCQEAVETGFPSEVANGTVSWTAINTDLAENKHYEEQFELTFSSVIAAKYESGNLVEWKNLPNVWRLTRDEDGMMDYVQREIRAWLE